MNYAMHPIHFCLSGVIRADFPGEAARYVEELFENQTVAVFSQGASGCQNPRLAMSASYFLRLRDYLSEGQHPPPQIVGTAPLPLASQTPQGSNAAGAGSSRKAIPPENMEAYK